MPDLKKVLFVSDPMNVATDAVVEKQDGSGNLRITLAVHGQRVTLDPEAAFEITLHSPLSQRLFWWAMRLSGELRSQGVSQEQMARWYLSDSLPLEQSLGLMASDFKDMAGAAARLGLVEMKERQEGGEEDN